MVKTVPFDIITNFLLGMVIALALRRGVRAEKNMVINRYFLAVILFEAFFFLPLGTYLYFFYPDWSLMFFIDPASVQGYMKIIGLAAMAGYMAAIVGGFLTGAWLIRKDQPKTALIIIAALAVALGAFSLITFRQLMEVGTYADWMAVPRTTVPFYTHKIGYIVGLSSVAMFGALVWMIRVLGRTTASEGAHN